VKDFSAQVQRSDKIALIGPNGCGKTTLLKLMLGQLQADSGRIHVGTKLKWPISISTAPNWIR
jgi:ATP-binding cassette subfamily F protein uup